MSAAVALLVLVGPFAMVFVALRIADRAEALRWDAIERQIAVTDAIHRELGAVVRPSTPEQFTEALKADEANVSELLQKGLLKPE